MRQKVTLRAIKSQFGLSEEQYARMILEQEDKCKICNGVETQKRNRFRLSIDHCHSTKRLRGLLCTKCNTGIGCFMDNPKLLLAAAEYLDFYVKHPGPKVPTTRQKHMGKIEVKAGESEMASKIRGFETVESGQGDVSMQNVSGKLQKASGTP